MTDPVSGDQAFLARDNQQTWHEMTYGGALSFARRRYSRRLENVDVVVSGIPYDCAVTSDQAVVWGRGPSVLGQHNLPSLNIFPLDLIRSIICQLLIMGIAILTRITRKACSPLSSSMPT